MVQVNVSARASEVTPFTPERGRLAAAPEEAGELGQMRRLQVQQDAVSLAAALLAAAR